MRVCVYTANYGGYDNAFPQIEQDIDVDWLYITDDDATAVPAPWERCVGVPWGDWPDGVDTPMMQAKFWKTHPPSPYDYAIWIDANMQVTSSAFAREAIAALGDAPLAVWRHPRRTCIYDEVLAAIGPERQGDKYDDAALMAQGKTYYAEGYPKHNGLYACGTIVWTPAAVKLGEQWWEECAARTPQDQVSLPVVCWRAGVTPAVFPYPQLPRRFNHRLHAFENRWMLIKAHR